MLFDYETLKLIWWGLVGVLLIGFAIMDGHDMGVGCLLPFVGKTDEERRVVINTIGAHWEGNQVWFITAGGAIFASLPLVYATAFSGFYWVLLLVLWALFLRPVGFKYRSMINHPKWRNAWDWCLFVGSFVPAFVFGVAFGNLFLGVPFSFDEYLMSSYSGSVLALLNPFALLCGVVSTSMLIMQGGIYLSHRTVGQIQARAKHGAIMSVGVLLVSFLVAGWWLATLDGYVIISSIDKNGVIDPMSKTVMIQSGAWLHNFERHEWLWGFVGIGVIMPIMAMIALKKDSTLMAFVCSSLALFGVIMTAGVALFPFYLPSSSHPNHSLTVWDSTSSQLTLMVMLYVVVVLLPMVVAYTSWAYAIMRGKITQAYIKENEHTLY